MEWGRDPRSIMVTIHYNKLSVFERGSRVHPRSQRGYPDFPHTSRVFCAKSVNVK